MLKHKKSTFSLINLNDHCENDVKENDYEAPRTNCGIFYDLIIQLCSGVTLGKVRNGELYPQRF